MEQTSSSRLRSVVYMGVFLLMIGVVFWAVFGVNSVLEKSRDRDLGMPSLQLASISENGVRVDLELQPTRGGWAWLSARFTPLESEYHLYAKDLPRQDGTGIGQPTLLELALGSKLRAIGTLVDNRVAKVENLVPDQPALAVYPAGPVTLLLPVELPAGRPGWIDDQVSVTYMACSPHGCLSPVLSRLIPIRVPVIMDDQEGLLQASLNLPPFSEDRDSSPVVRTAASIHIP